LLGFGDHLLPGTEVVPSAFREEDRGFDFPPLLLPRLSRLNINCNERFEFLKLGWQLLDTDAQHMDVCMCSLETIFSKYTSLFGHTVPSYQKRQVAFVRSPFPLANLEHVESQENGGSPISPFSLALYQGDQMRIFKKSPKM
jgi:hypothetical protein